MSGNMNDGRERMLSVVLVNPTQQQSLYIPDMHEILIGRLNLDYDEIEGVQQHGGAPKVFTVMVTSMSVWNNRSLDSFIGRKYDLSYGRRVVIDRPYVELTHVIVKGVPMFWNMEKMNKLFSWYGDVRRIQRDVWRKREQGEQQFNGTWNGSYKVIMKVNRSIPSSITVGGVRVEIHYRDQGVSCWRCGLAHVRRECDTHYTRFVNRFNSFDDFNEEEHESDAEKQPVAEQPIAEQPIAEQPIAEQPVNEEKAAGYSAGLLPSRAANGEIVKGYDIPGETEEKEEASKQEQRNKEPLNTKENEKSENHEDKLPIKAPVIFKETESDEDTTDDDAIMKADKEQGKNLEFNRQEEAIIMAMQEASVINKDGEEMVITQIVEEPGSQEIHAGSTVVQFHHRDCSQLEGRESENEKTLTASEPEDLFTPAQKTEPPGNDVQVPLSRELSIVEEDHLMEVQSQLSGESSSLCQASAERETGKSKRVQSSTDEESDNVNVVGINTGTFYVNSMYSRKDGSEKKKVKNK